MRFTMIAACCLCLACETPKGGAPVALAQSPTPSNLTQLPDLESSEAVAKEFPSFDAYWYRGKAELSSFTVEQSRYGALHRGEAVLIFVTEDFLKTRQVKYEGQGDKSDAVSVLKLNLYQHFNTGVYPYTLMTSVFSEAKAASALPLKLTFSATEWCGQAFMQLNRRDAGYDFEERSYFEAEGDRNSKLALTILEDGLWTRIRQDPQSLPLGRIKLLPSARHARLDHVPFQPMDAEASLSAEADGKRSYRVKYDSGRELVIHFETRFPRRIVAFEETPKAGAPTTRAKLVRSIMLPYWEKHGPNDAAYRQALGLTPM